MSRLFLLPKTWVIISASLIFLILSFWLEPASVLLLVLLAGVLFLAFTDYKLGLLSLLFLRPLIDLLVEYPVITVGGNDLNMASLLAIGTILFGGVILLKNKSEIKKIPLLIPIALFLAVTLISIFYSAYPALSLAEWLRILSLFSIFISAFLILKTPEDFKKLTWIIVASAILPGFLALFQFFTETGMTIPSEDIYNRIYGTFVHPNVFAHFLVVPLSLLLLFILNDLQKKKIQPLIIFTLLFLLIALTLTYTRSAWLAFLAIVLIVGIVRYRKLLIISFVIIFLVYLAVEPIRLRVNGLLSSDPQSSTQWRIQLWKDTLGYIQESPLLGQGTGTAKEVILEKRGIKFGSSDAHNDYLKILMENGILGIIVYLGLVFTLFKNIIRDYLVTKSNEGLIILGLTVALFSIALVDNILRNTPLQWEYWALIGAFLATNKNLKK